MSNSTPTTCCVWVDRSATLSVSNKRFKAVAACRPGNKKGSVLRRCPAFFSGSLRLTSALPLLLADLGFVDRLIQMFNGLDAMAVEIMLRGLQMVFGIRHRFQRFVDVRVLFGRGRRGCCRNRSRRRNRRRRSFGPGSRRREGQREEKCCHDEQSQQPDLSQMFLLVRIPARTQPV